MSSFQDEADARGVPLQKVLAEHGDSMLGQPHGWEALKDVDVELPKGIIQAKIINDECNDILTRLSNAISEKIKFPVNTVFMHGLGVLASAMTKSFYVDCEGEEIPVNLFVVTAQPPSTGKSGVNNILSEPIAEAFNELNDSKRNKRIFITKMRDKAKNDLEKCKDDDEFLLTELSDKVHKYEKQLREIPEYVYSLDDATIEAAEMVAANQNGMFNIISAEAESVNVVLGGVYGDSNKKTNFNLVLKAWDGERASSVRVGRDGYRGKVKASIAVIAQYDSVDTILAAGAKGRGLAERFLLLSEPSNLGQRVYGKKRTNLDPNLRAEYARLVSNIVNEERIVFTISELSWLHIEHERKKYEKRMAAGGDFTGNMIIGFAGKANKQILKIASVIHACEAWADGGNRSTELSDSSVARAVSVFNKMCDAYVTVSDELGHAGIKTEIYSLIEYIEGRTKSKIYKMKINDLQRNIRKRNPFMNVHKLSAHLREKLLPILERSNYIVLHNNMIYFSKHI